MELCHYLNLNLVFVLIITSLASPGFNVAHTIISCICNLTRVFIFIYFMLYIAFNSQGNIAIGNLQVEEPV